MNRYSFSSDSDRWWYPTAIAGTVAAAAVTAIFVAPVVAAQATQVVTPLDNVAVPSSESSVLVDRPCYLARSGWNTPAGWEQPVCSTEVRRGAIHAPGAGQPRPGYLP